MIETVSQPSTQAGSVKDSVRDVLSRLPEDCTWNQVLYHLNVRAKLEVADAQAERGELVPHEEVLRRFGLSGHESQAT